MIAFWFTAALLLLVAYALFLPALRGTLDHRGVDRQQLNLLLHRQRREDLARELPKEDVEVLEREMDKDLLSDLSAVEKTAVASKAADSGRVSLILALVAVPLVAGLAYSQLGRPDLADFKPEARAAAAGHTEGQVPGDFNTMIDRLAERLKNEPDNLQGWMLLARSYHETRQFDKAVEAYGKVLAKAPDNLDAKGYYAESLGEVAGSFRGKPLDLANEIIQLAPKNHNALWILGAAAAESGDGNKAGGYFKKLRAEFPKDSEDYKHLTQIIAQVGGDGAPEPAGAGASAAMKKSIKVKVSLAPALKKKATADDTVFVFAKAASGPPMPLAIVRKKVKDLPAEVTLDDSMGMTAGMNLSAFEQVVIGARISKTGNALPAAGDLQGLNTPVAARSGKTYSVKIDREVEEGTAAAPAPAAAEEETPAADGTAIKVKVSLSGALRAKAADDDTVFIFAKAAAGPPMPLAIVRKQVKDLPVEVTLDDSMAMMPGKNLSSAPQVIIGARISKSGNALPAPGDLQGMSAPTLAQSGQSYAVEISSEVH
jgi:cytochrome c-type biogenesis protein CcmH